MDFLQVTIALETDIIISRRTTLDSLLAGILFHRYDDPDRAIAEVPIATRHGVPQASQALLETVLGQRLQEAQLGQFFARDLINDARLHDTLVAVPERVEVGRGDFQNIINRVTSLPTPRVFFLARGEIDAITTILSEVRFIGSQRKQGYGKVADFEVFRVATDNADFALVGANCVLRPVPLRLQAHLPASVQYAVLNETWHNPYLPRYAGAVVEPCMVPPFMQGEGFSIEEIERFHHA